MDSNSINCPNCSALNPSRQGRCEACGSSLDWALWSQRNAAPKYPRHLVAAACLLGGLATGAVASSWLKPQVPPATPVPPVPPAAVQTPPPVALAPGERPQIDVVFVIDTTGSMEDEIEVVKTQVREMMSKVQSGQPRPYVRFGVVAFRDRGDAYVTKSFPLTADIQSIQSTVNELQADGGGDVPEAVNEALHVGLQGMNWNFDQKTKRVLFLIGDAAPHMDYANDYDYRDEMDFARRKGIKVHTWGCSGITDSGNEEFRQIAALGQGSFQYLTYRQEVVKNDGSRTSVLYQGTRCYEVKSAKADWKRGADTLGGSDATALSSRAVCAPSAGSAAKFEASSGYRGAAGKMENNLDRVLTEQVMEEGRNAGIRY